MRTVLVRYKTKKSEAAANEALVHAVFDELRARKLAGLRYGTFKLADGVSFVHIATMDKATSSDALTSLPAFKAFQKNLADRVAEPPVVTELVAVDTYGF
jgi:hypothetical protein